MLSWALRDLWAEERKGFWTKTENWEWVWCYKTHEQFLASLESSSCRALGPKAGKDMDKPRKAWECPAQGVCGLSPAVYRGHWGLWLGLGPVRTRTDLDKGDGRRDGESRETESLWPRLKREVTGLGNDVEKANFVNLIPNRFIKQSRCCCEGSFEVWLTLKLVDLSKMNYSSYWEWASPNQLQLSRANILVSRRNLVPRLQHRHPAWVPSLPACSVDFRLVSPCNHKPVL